MEQLRLKLIPGTFAVCKVEDYSGVDLSGRYSFTAGTDEENSLVCLSENVPENATSCDDGWRAFRVEDILDFSLIGILARISGILAENNVGIFVVSTYNTDYIFVKKENLEKAMHALESRGYTFAG